jgi:hypothetical protein
MPGVVLRNNLTHSFARKSDFVSDNLEIGSAASIQSVVPRDYRAIPVIRWYKEQFGFQRWRGRYHKKPLNLFLAEPA